MSFAGGEPCGQNEPGTKKTIAVRADRRHGPVADVQPAHVPRTRTSECVHGAQRRECFFFLNLFQRIVYFDWIRNEVGTT